ncbi:MAG: hypothetical protein AAGA80_00850 [Cyanobacteria bacterium P01_F01_bin.143]
MVEKDPNFQNKVDNYYKEIVWARWKLVIFLWLTLGTYGIWSLRHEIKLWLDYFTWSAVRYGLKFNMLSTICLAICIGFTLSTMVWQSRNIIWGLSDKEKYYLEQRVKDISYN